jgi:hypothetical protein
MSELEAAFQAYLEELRGNNESVEMQVKLLRDALVPQFISKDYPLSMLTSDIAKLVNVYRHERAVLGRIGGGRYLYDPKGVASTLDSKYVVGRYAELPRLYPSLVSQPQVIVRPSFNSLQELVNSSDSLVMRNLKSIDFRIYDDLSF